MPELAKVAESSDRVIRPMLPVPTLPTVGPPPAAASAPVVYAPPAKPASNNTLPAAPELPSAGPLPDVETAAKIRTVQEVLQAIDAAPSLDERLTRIADGAKHRESVAKFFEAHAGGIKVGGVDSNVGFFNELPSGEDVKLYLAITASCPSGAMVRLHGSGDKARLDWPLFEQTHQLEFDRFVQDGGAAPRRFSVICARSRTNELTGPSKDEYLALRAQGSLSLHGEGLLYVKKESPAGKFLDSRMVWGRGYLIHALIQHGKLDEKAVLTLEDCEGAPAGAK
jgi:hypothetical protein